MQAPCLPDINIARALLVWHDAALLKDTGLYEACQLKPALNMKRENYKEYFA